MPLEFESITATCEKAVEIARAKRKGKMLWKYGFLSDPDRHIGIIGFDRGGEKHHVVFEYHSIPSKPNTCTGIVARAFRKDIDKDDETGLEWLVARVKHVYPGNLDAQQLTTQAVFSILWSVTCIGCQCPVSTSDSSGEDSDTSTDTSSDSSPDDD